jgi:hypothetical protein
MHTRTVIALAGALLLVGSAGALAEQHKEKAAAGSDVSCDDIQAAWDEGGGAVSEDMLSKKMNVSVERIRACLKKEAMEEEKAETPPK